MCCNDEVQIHKRQKRNYKQLLREADSKQAIVDIVSEMILLGIELEDFADPVRDKEIYDKVAKAYAC